MARAIPKMIVRTIISKPLETDVQENSNATLPDRALNNLSTAVGAQMKQKLPLALLRQGLSGSVYRVAAGDFVAMTARPAWQVSTEGGRRGQDSRWLSLETQRQPHPGFL
ncbi:hypothetical protein SISSUDRAFT_1055815, partial [Sistotremastrum suecicum HHB10207 ss-3]